jgi:aspartate carbamoyltransferase catalytic subunit
MFMKRNVLSMREFSREEIDSVLDLAASLEPYARGKKSDMMAGKILGTALLRAVHKNAHVL